MRDDDDAMIGMLFDDGRAPLECNVARSEFYIQNEEFQPARTFEILVAVVVAVFETSTPPAFFLIFGWRKELIDATGIANHLSALAIDPCPVEVVVADVEAVGEITIQFLMADNGTFPLNNIVELDNITFVTNEGNSILLCVLLQPTRLAGVDIRIPV